VSNVQPIDFKRAFALEFKDKLSLFEFQYKRIPYYMQDGILDYVLRGTQPGDFLTGVICNDLKKACWHADAENIWLIPVYAAFFYNHAPMESWGSKENYESWLAKKGVYE
jgi:hypothetical protein